MKEFTDSFGLDSLMLSVYVEKINTLMRVGAVLDAVARMWDAEFLRRSTKPPAKIRGGSLAWRRAAKGGPRLVTDLLFIVPLFAAGCVAK